MTGSARRLAPVTALLVHGNAGSARTWGRVVEALAPIPAVAIDLPGFGASAADAPDLGALDGDALDACIDAYVGAVADAARGIGGPIVLAGNGIGSVLCGHAALRLGDLARGVVMTGPVGLRGGHARLGVLSRSRSGAALLRLVGRSLGRARFLGDQLATPGSDPEAARILLDALAAARGFDRLAVLNDPRSLEGLRALRCAVTVLWGARDGVLPAGRAPEFAALLPAHARTEIVAGVGHALPLERPDAVAAAIRAL